MTIQIGMFNLLSPQLLRAYLYLRSYKSGKVKWDNEFKKEFAKFLGVEVSTLRTIVYRLRQKGVVEWGGNSWLFAIGSKRLHTRLLGKKRAVVPPKAMRSTKAMRRFSRAANICNVIKTYGNSGLNKKGRPVKYQRLSHDYLARTLSWSRSTVRRYRNNKSGYLKVQKDYEIIDVSGQFRERKDVIKHYFHLKSLLPGLYGDDFRTVRNMKLHTTKTTAAIWLEIAPVVYSNIPILPPPR